jgi:tripartite-type tricarboxylate transporter receptor subunit TctC
MKFTTRRSLLLAPLLALGMSVAWAQTYPSKPVRLIVPFAPGGFTDVVARILGQKLSASMGQQWVIENKAGAGSTIGTDFVAKAAPDGYTLLMTSAGILTANQFLYAKMPFDPEKDFIPVSNVADMPMMVVVNPNVQAKTLAELVALARANPGKLNFGSPGIGTTGHLGLALLMHAADIKLTHIPYKGAAPAITDLIAGQIDGVVDNPPTVLPHIEAGRLRPLAVAAKQRMALLPDLPTAAEAGVSNYEASSWFGVVAPAGTPPAIVEKLHKAIAAGLAQPALRARFAKTGARLLGNSPDEFAQQITSDRKMWGTVIKSAGITPQ